jgi:hypothetical protein
MAWSDFAGERGDEARARGCDRHPEEPEAARCGECQRGMCRRCFDEAPWPWKLCATCHTVRAVAVPAPIAEPDRAPAPIPAVAIEPDRG